MASPNAAATLNVPGRVIFNGLELGITRENEFHPNIRTSYVTAEEIGNAPVEHFVQGTSPVFACILRSFDASVMSAIFPAYAPNVLSGSAQPGKSLKSKVGVLLFVPDAGSHPGVTFYEATPLVEDTAIIRFSWDSNMEFGVQAIFHGLPDSSGRTWAWV